MQHLDMNIEDSLSRSLTSSPFHEAAARPLLGEPTKKRWSPFGNNNSNNSHGKVRSLSTIYRDHTDLVQTHSIEFERSENSNNYDDEEMGNIFQLSFDEHVDLNVAVMKERHQEIIEINSSIIHLNQIQKGSSL